MLTQSGHFSHLPVTDRIVVYTQVIISFITNRGVWVSCQIRKIAGCACAGNAGNDFPATDFQGNRELAIPATSRHVRHARAVMDVGIASPRPRGERSRHSRRVRNPRFYLSGKRPMDKQMYNRDWEDNYCETASSLWIIWQCTLVVFCWYIPHIFSVKMNICLYP